MSGPQRVGRTRLYIGDKIHELEVIADAGKVNGRRAVVVRCVCGTEKTLSASHLVGGRTKSCGCMRPALVSASTSTHGMRQSAEWRTWRHMKSRCFNPNVPGFEHWGGRGITVCPEWVNDFMAFYEHIGPKPSPSHSIDRIDVDGNYEPGNVRWATRIEQANNKQVKTHCRKGHEYTPENTRVTRQGWRRCRRCRAINEGTKAAVA